MSASWGSAVACGVLCKIGLMTWLKERALAGWRGLRVRGDGWPDIADGVDQGWLTWLSGGRLCVSVGGGVAARATVRACSRVCVCALPRDCAVGGWRRQLSAADTALASVVHDA
eukprot:Rmarinus@m.14652